MTVGVTITLDADHSYMTLAPFVVNDTAVSHNYQYWLNAMIALGDTSDTVVGMQLPVRG